MKKTLFILFASLLSLVSQAQTISIATARTRDTGTVVTVTGIATSGTELGAIRYFQDNTGGLAAFGGVDNVKRGDSIVITGKLTYFRNLLQLSPVSSVQIISSNRPLPTPKVLTFAQIADSLESQLVTYQDVRFATTGNFAAGVNYNIQVGAAATPNTQIRVSAPCPTLVGFFIPTNDVTLTGILSQFCTTPATGCTTGYQTLLRDTADIIFKTINITAGLTATNVSTTGFTVNWQTSIEGTTVIKYGTTPALGQTATVAGTRTAHTYTFTGLSPATIYYVQGESAANGSVARTAITPFVTTSTSTGEMRVFFNRSVDTTFRVGNARPIGTTGSRIITDLNARIDAATQTIDVAMYSSGETSIVAALKRAAARGVRVRYITDRVTANVPFADTTGLGFTFVKSTNQNLMHNKFFIFDAGSVNNSWLWGGSTNNSIGQLNNDPNNAILIQDQALARVYTAEFEEMWGSSTATPNATVAKYGIDKTKNTPRDLVIGGKKVEVYFSPSDGTTAAIVKEIDAADTDLQFALLIHTANETGTAIFNALRRGARTRGLVDKDTATTGDEYFYLSSRGVSMRLYNDGTIFHHKYCVIDATNAASNPTVLTGSHNWSATAETRNDENMLVIHDPAIANIYLQEFEARWKESARVGTKEVTIEGFNATIFPNPASEMVNLSIKNDINRDIAITLSNALGQPLETRILRNVSGDTTLNYPLSNLPSGQYFISFMVDGKMITKALQVVK